MFPCFSFPNPLQVSSISCEESYWAYLYPLHNANILFKTASAKCRSCRSDKTRVPLQDQWLAGVANGLCKASARFLFSAWNAGFVCLIYHWHLSLGLMPNIARDQFNITELRSTDKVLHRSTSCGEKNTHKEKTIEVRLNIFEDFS